MYSKPKLFKDIASFCRIGTLVRMQIKGDLGSITGRVVFNDGTIVNLQHRDSRISLVKISQIVLITEVPEQETV
jgi:hypothetical protein